MWWWENAGLSLWKRIMLGYSNNSNNNNNNNTLFNTLFSVLHQQPDDQ
jgi:hypothetical protein